MAKSYSLVFIVLFLLTLGSCQSLEQIPIDYLQPADLSFPPQLRKVAIVNNTSDAPDNKLITETEKIKEGTPLISRATAYANGDPKTATESLAEEIAQQNYFDEVVICDSALRANDKLARESTLSQEEVRQLASNLGVDFIIALENLQLKATKTVRYLDEFNCFQGAVDVKVYPTVKVYLPERSRPMTTLHPNDSIFWEEFGGTAIEAATRMIPRQADAGRSGSIRRNGSGEKYCPYLEKKEHGIFILVVRFLCVTLPFMYAKIHGTTHTNFGVRLSKVPRTKRKKMRAALNIAVYYEMKDSLAKAEEWAEKAQQLAKK